MKGFVRAMMLSKTSMSAPAPILVIVLTRERAAHIKTFAMEASL